MGIAAAGLPGRRGSESRRCGLDEARVCCNTGWLMLFIERVLGNKRAMSKNAGWCLAELSSPWQVGPISSQKHVWKTRKKKGKVRADLKTGSEVGICQMAFSLD